MVGPMRSAAEIVADRLDAHVTDFDRETSNLHSALGSLVQLLVEKDVISESEGAAIDVIREAPEDGS
jgi:hypothetical protein